MVHGRVDVRVTGPLPVSLDPGPYFSGRPRSVLQGRTRAQPQLSMRLSREPLVVGASRSPHSSARALLKRIRL
jgi:hypothetical protein